MWVRGVRTVGLGLLAALMVLLAAGHCSARVWYVSPGGHGGADGQAWFSAAGSVQKAINAAAEGDEVWASAGVYNECVSLREGVSLYGGFAGAETARDQRDWRANTTVLDGGKRGSVVMIPAGISRATSLDGFTIRNGRATNGGGIRCQSSSPTIAHCTITANAALAKGGGIYASLGASPLVRGNTITGNTAKVGGGLSLEGRGPLRLAAAPQAAYPYVGVSQAANLSIRTQGAEGDSLTYRWTALDGGAVLGTGPQVRFSDTRPGVRRIAVQVEDQHGGSVGGTITVTVIAVAIDAPLPALTTGREAVLHATVAPAVEDTPDYPLRLTWSVATGPSTGSFGAANGTAVADQARFTPTASGPGVLQVKLAVGTAETSAQAAYTIEPKATAITPNWMWWHNSARVVVSGTDLDRVDGLGLGTSGVRGHLWGRTPQGGLDFTLYADDQIQPGVVPIVLHTPEGDHPSGLQFDVRAAPLQIDPKEMTVRQDRKVTFEVWLPDPAPYGGVVVSLSSSDPVVLPVPPTVSIPGSDRRRTVELSPQATGTAVVTATLDPYLPGSASVRVLPALRLSLTPLPSQAHVGQTQLVAIDSTDVAPEGGVRVALSGGSGLVELPPEATIPTSKSRVVVPVKAVGEGSITLVASAAGYPNASLPLAVTPAPLSLYPKASTTQAGRSVALTLSLPAAAPAGGVSVSLVSSDPTVVSVPVQAVVPEGQRTVVVEAVGAGLGIAAITATSPGQENARAEVSVQEQYGLSFSQPEISIVSGHRAGVTLLLSRPAPAPGVTVSLACDRAGVLELPASVSILAGEMTADLDIEVVSGSPVPVMVTASSPGAVEGTIAVAAQPRVQPSLLADVTVGMDCVTSGIVTIDRALPGDLSVALSSADSTTLAVDDSVVIAAGKTHQAFQLRGIRAGTCAVRAEADGVTVSATAAVVQPSFTLTFPATLVVGSGDTLAIRPLVSDGTSYEWYQVIDPAGGEVDRYRKVALTQPTLWRRMAPLVVSDNPSVVGATPPSADASWFREWLAPLEAVGRGECTLTVQMEGWRPASASLAVVGFDLYAEVTVGLARYTMGAVLLPGGRAASPKGFTIALESSDPDGMSVPASVKVEPGLPYGEFPVYGWKAGTYTLKASGGGFSRECLVTVEAPEIQVNLPRSVPFPRIPLKLTLDTQVAHGTQSLVMGGTSYRVVKAPYTPQSLVLPMKVSLEADQPGILAVPSIVTIPDGTWEVGFEVGVVGRGTTRIKLSSPGCPDTWTGPISVGAVGLTAAATGSAGGAGSSARTSGSQRGNSVGKVRAGRLPGAAPGGRRGGKVGREVAEGRFTSAIPSGFPQGAAGPLAYLFASAIGQAPPDPLAALVEANLVSANSAELGGGVALSSSAASLRSNLIVGNSAVTLGGGVYAAGYTAASSLSRCTLARNRTTSGKGGGVYAASGLPAIDGSVLWQNGDDLWGCVATFSCVSSVTEDPGTGNLSVDPGFVQTSDPDAPGFYRLAPGSSLVGVGDPAAIAEPGEVDIDGEPRLVPPRMDVGADEQSDAASVPPSRLTVGSAVALAGGLAEVPVTAEGALDLASARFVLDLGPLAEKEQPAIEVIAGSGTEGGSFTCGPLTEGRRCEVAVVVAGHRVGPLALLRVAVPSMAKPGTAYALVIASGQATIERPDGSTVVVHPALVPGSVTVVARGDASADGSVNVGDVLILLRISLGVATATADQRVAGDLNGDGSITVADVLMALRIALHLG